MSNVKKRSGMMMKRFNKMTPETMRARLCTDKALITRKGKVRFS